MNKKLLTENEICKTIIKQGKCTGDFKAGKCIVCGCPYCPFGADNNYDLDCINYTGFNNSKEVVKQAKKFLARPINKPRNIMLTIRVNEKELDNIKKNAMAEGMTVSKFIRMLTI